MPGFAVSSLVVFLTACGASTADSGSLAGGDTCTLLTAGSDAWSPPHERHLDDRREPVSPPAS